MLKQKFKNIFDKFITPYFMCSIFWLIAYVMFCLHPSNLLLGVSITLLIFAQSDFISKKIELSSEIYEILDRQTIYTNSVIEQNKDLQKEMAPFRDAYFKDLSAEEIASLAKTRLRVGAEAQEYRHVLESIKQLFDSEEISRVDLLKIKKEVEVVLNDYIQ